MCVETELSSLGKKVDDNAAATATEFQRLHDRVSGLGAEVRQQIAEAMRHMEGAARAMVSSHAAEDGRLTDAKLDAVDAAIATVARDGQQRGEIQMAALTSITDEIKGARRWALGLLVTIVGGLLGAGWALASFLVSHSGQISALADLLAKHGASQ